LWAIAAFSILGTFFLLYRANDDEYQMHPHEGTIIQVMIPHFKNVKFLLLCLQLLKMRQSNDSSIIVKYTVFTQEDTKEERDKVKEAIKDNVEVIDFPQPGKVGGAALFEFFKVASRVAKDSQADIAVTVDVDALTLASNWDLKLRNIFQDEQVVLAAISPRFDGNAEWNWMAFSPRFYYKHIRDWKKLKFHDWGHWFTSFADSKQHLWANRYYPIPSKSPIVSGDKFDKYWALHMFYTTRRQSENNLESESGTWTTPEESEKIIKWALSTTLQDIEEYFGNEGTL